MIAILEWVDSPAATWPIFAALVVASIVVLALDSRARGRRAR